MPVEAVELVVLLYGAAVQRVQTVEVDVMTTVETVFVTLVKVDEPEVWVTVTGQVVRVVMTISVVLSMVAADVAVETMVVLLGAVVVVEQLPPGTFNCWPSRSLSQSIPWFALFRSAKGTWSLSAIP